MTLWQRIVRVADRWLPARRLAVAPTDSLPPSLPPRALVLVRDDGQDWSIGMRCPCGCGEAIELLLIDEVKPRWTLSIDARGRPSLHPSVWRTSGCRSHFWLKSGRVSWC
jgi:hypothetical protein